MISTPDLVLAVMAISLWIGGGFFAVAAFVSNNRVGVKAAWIFWTLGVGLWLIIDRGRTSAPTALLAAALAGLLSWICWNGSGHAPRPPAGPYAPPPSVDGRARPDRRPVGPSPSSVALGQPGATSPMIGTTQHHRVCHEVVVHHETTVRHVGRTPWGTVQDETVIDDGALPPELGGPQ